MSKGRRNVPLLWGRISSGVAALVYLLRDEFTTDDAAPVTSPRTCEPGPGTLTAIQNDGNLSISSGKLNFPAQTTPSYGDQGFYLGATAARVSGRALFMALTQSSGLKYMGHAISTGVSYTQFESGSLDFHSNNNIYIFKSDGNLMFAGNLRTWINGTEYLCLVVQRGTGCLFFIKVSSTWYLYGVTYRGTANVSPAFGNYNGVGTMDRLRVFDLQSPWNSDFGICTNYVASPAVNETITQVADGMVEMTWIAVTGQTWNLYIRRTDDSNCWAVRCSQGGRTIKLIEINGGVETERASAAQTFSNGTSYRVSAYMEGNKIRVHLQVIGGNQESEFLYYASATFNNTATWVKTDRAGSNLAAWPLVLSGSALAELERWIA